MNSTYAVSVQTLGLGVLLLFAPSAAHAKDTAPPPIVARSQTRAFGLGYALRLADLQAVAYTQSVQRLKGVSDPQMAGAEVAHLSDDVAPLRHAQAASYAAAAALLNKMGAPQTLREWAAHSAEILNAPLIYSSEAKKLAKSEPGTALVLAELGEIRTLKSAADAQQTPMTLWMQVTGGKLTPWTANVGAYAAELRRVSHAVAPSPVSSITARLLLLHAPPGAPTEARDSLATLIPSGGGNLQNLATIAPENVTSQKIMHVYETLLTLYNADAQAESLDKSAG